MFCSRQRWVVAAPLNILNTTELYNLKWYILCLGVFYHNLKTTTKEMELGRQQSPLAPSLDGGCFHSDNFEEIILANGVSEWEETSGDTEAAVPERDPGGLNQVERSEQIGATRSR